MHVLLGAAEDSSFWSELADALVGGAAVAVYVTAVVGAAVTYLLYRRLGMHVVIHATRFTLPVVDSEPQTRVRVRVTNRGKKKLQLVQCQIVIRNRRGPDEVALPIWTTVDGTKVEDGWPDVVLENEISAAVEFAFPADKLSGSEQAKAQVGARFKARYSDITAGPPVGEA